MNFSKLNRVLLKLSKRAESNDWSKLVDTFVDVGPLFTLLSNAEHQILYGRRGTGKTHALIYLYEMMEDKGDLPIYLDLRKIGSTGGLYSDPQISIPERATRLLSDTLSAIHDKILEYAIDNEDKVDLSAMGPTLDNLAKCITEVRIAGPVEREESTGSGHKKSESSELGINITPNNITGGVNSKKANDASAFKAKKTVTKGDIKHRIHFGSTTKYLQELSEGLPDANVWVLLDEWSSIPIDLQPYLADFIRRTMFPIKGFVIKIAAIDQRTNFKIAGERGEYIGIEVGADAGADLNLDDYMVFDNDESKATKFFQELIFRHYKSIDPANDDELPQTSDELIKMAFTQSNTFEEFVRASEGVPRDAIYILGGAVQKAYDSAINISNIRSAARSWYQRDKEAAATANSKAKSLLHWIIDQVIGHRQARAFLLESNTRHHLIDTLYDARVLHLLKRNISARDEPGERYDVYKLDYGCYVDLLATSRAPQGLLFKDNDEGKGEIEIPKDDYRAVRRAILDIAEFERRR